MHSKRYIFRPKFIPSTVYNFEHLVHLVYKRWVPLLPSFTDKIVLRYGSYRQIFKQPLPYRLGFCSFKSYYNNRPRFNTTQPTYFLTFGLMRDYWGLGSRSSTRPNMKFLTLFFRFYIFSPHYMVVVDKYTRLGLLWLRTCVNLYNFQTLLFLFPTHFCWFYKYKKYRSIKKWVKKKLYRLHKRSYISST